MSGIVAKLRKDRRRAEFAELAGMFSIAASAVLTSLLVALDGAALWTAVPATAFMVYGVLATARTAIIASFGLAGVSVIVATTGAELATGLLITAAAATILVLLVPATDLAFTSRRRTVLHPVVVPGMIRVHVIAALTGSAWVLTIVSLVVLVAWPDAAVTIAMGVLAIAALTLAALVARHRRNVVRLRSAVALTADGSLSGARIAGGREVRPS